MTSTPQWELRLGLLQTSLRGPKCTPPPMAYIPCHQKEKGSVPLHVQLSKYCFCFALPPLIMFSPLPLCRSQSPGKHILFFLSCSERAGSVLEGATVQAEQVGLSAFGALLCQQSVPERAERWEQLAFWCAGGSRGHLLRPVILQQSPCASEVICLRKQY